MDKIYRFKKPISIIVVGKKGRGKTNLIKHLILYNTVYNKYFQFGIVFTGTKYDNEYDYIDEDENIIQGWDESVFDKYVSYLEEQKEKLGKKMPPNFMILDDLIGKLQKSGSFTNFVCCIRHLNCTLILSTQYLRKVTATELRENMDLAFMFRTNNGLSIDGAFEAFGGQFRKIDHFKSALYAATKEPHACMVYIDEHDSIKDCYKKYKAPNMTKVKTKIKF